MNGRILTLQGLHFNIKKKVLVLELEIQGWNPYSVVYLFSINKYGVFIFSVSHNIYFP
jgi:hypothetical protein